MSTSVENKLIESISAPWFETVGSEFEKDYMQELKKFLALEIKKYRIYPPSKDTFNAFKFCPLNQLKVVILGQDPYHGPGQAHGLCFSVQEGIDRPPSLINIFKELHQDLGIPVSKKGDLSKWAKQGVFLLNTVLSVREHQAGSHFNQGWEKFTDKVIEIINKDCEYVVYMLWGSPARAKKYMITNRNHLVLEAPHPSPLSAHRGFFGSKHFSQANEYLEAKSLAPIDWSLD